MPRLKVGSLHKSQQPAKTATIKKVKPPVVPDPTPPSAASSKRLSATSFGSSSSGSEPAGHFHGQGHSFVNGHGPGPGPRHNNSNINGYHTQHRNGFPEEDPYMVETGNDVAHFYGGNCHQQQHPLDSVNELAAARQYHHHHQQQQPSSSGSVYGVLGDRGVVYRSAGPGSVCLVSNNARGSLLTNSSSSPSPSSSSSSGSSGGYEFPPPPPPPQVVANRPTFLGSFPGLGLQGNRVDSWNRLSCEPMSANRSATALGRNNMAAPSPTPTSGSRGFGLDPVTTLQHHQGSLEDQGIDLAQSPGRESPSSSGSSNSNSGTVSSSQISRHSISSSDSGRASSSISVPHSLATSLMAPHSNSSQHLQHQQHLQQQHQQHQHQQPLQVKVYPGPAQQNRLSFRSSFTSASVSSSSSSSLGSSIDGVIDAGWSSNGVAPINVPYLLSQGVRDSEVLNVWLTDLRFEEYYNLFLRAGYDMPTISRMTPEDLTAIGITKPSHRKKLKAEIAKLNISDGLPDYVPANLAEWLSAIHLEEYMPNLMHQGYTTVEQATELQWEDLEEIGISRLGHQKKIMLAVKRVKDILSGKRPPGVLLQPSANSPAFCDTSKGFQETVAINTYGSSPVVDGGSSSGPAGPNSNSAGPHPMRTFHQPGDAGSSSSSSSSSSASSTLTSHYKTPGTPPHRIGAGGLTAKYFPGAGFSPTSGFPRPSGMISVQVHGRGNSVESLEGGCFHHQQPRHSPVIQSAFGQSFPHQQQQHQQQQQQHGPAGFHPQFVSPSSGLVPLPKLRSSPGTPPSIPGPHWQQNGTNEPTYNGLPQDYHQQQQHLRQMSLIMTQPPGNQQGWRRSYDDGDITPTNEKKHAMMLCYELAGGGTLPRRPRSSSQTSTASAAAAAVAAATLRRKTAENGIDECGGDEGGSGGGGGRGAHDSGVYVEEDVCRGGEMAPGGRKVPPPTPKRTDSMVAGAGLSDSQLSLLPPPPPSEENEEYSARGGIEEEEEFPPPPSPLVSHRNKTTPSVGAPANGHASPGLPAVPQHQSTVSPPSSSATSVSVRQRLDAFQANNSKGRRAPSAKSASPSPSPPDSEDSSDAEHLLGFRQRRQDSNGSFKSTSSTESDSLPFANENAGTIKSRAGRQHCHQAPESGGDDKAQASPAAGHFYGKPGPASGEFYAWSDPAAARGASGGGNCPESGDVLNDIGNMLADLTDELDAMLEAENSQHPAGAKPGRPVPYRR